MIQDNLQLFDDFEREYTGPSRYSEPQWAFMNRSAWPEFHYIRELLQEWFDEFDATAEKRHRLCTEFRSSNDNEHLSAFFELYLYRLFKSQGFDIEVEPEWEQGRPDFLLTTPEGGKILLEATGTYPERWFGSAKRQEEIVIDYLNEHLDSPDYFLHINMESAPTGNPPFAQMGRYLQKQLAQLNYDDVVREAREREGKGLQRFPSIVWEHDAWTIEFLAIPKMETRGKPGVRPVGSMFYGVEWVDSASSIKSRIDSKYGHYGELDIPYILALNIVDTYADDDSVLDALLGQEAMYFNPDSDEVTISHQPNGAWFGPRGYQKRRMSAVCAFKRLRPEMMHIVNPAVWHHPFANNPLAPDVLSLTQQIVNPSTRSYERRDGQHPVALLNLDIERLPK